MKKITKKQWEKFVADKSTNSNDLLVCLAILWIWKTNAKNKEAAECVLMEKPFHLSKGQIEYAIDFAINHQPDGFVDTLTSSWKLTPKDNKD